MHGPDSHQSSAKKLKPNPGKDERERVSFDRTESQFATGIPPPISGMNGYQIWSKSVFFGTRTFGI